MAIEFVDVKTKEQKQTLAKIASEIWNEYWPALIGQAQTDYMVENFQSLNAIERDMANNNYEYWLLRNGEGEIVGYTGGHNETETSRFFISKIYLYKQQRGKHYASEVINFYTKLCKARNLSAMYLTVNKQNELGIRAYKGKGFDVIDSVETSIGSGFIMDDYIMKRKVS